MLSKNKIAALFGELLGVAALTLVFLSVSRVGLPPYFVALGVGVVVPFLVFAFGTNKTTPHLNPAVTVGLWTLRKIKSLDALAYVAFQLLGGYLGYLLFTYFVGTSLPAMTQDFTGTVLVAEAVGAFVLTFGWAAAYYRGYKQIAFGAVVGLAYAAGIMVVSTVSAGILNPAVALGDRYWIWGTYVLGPVLGGLIGFNLYSLLFAEDEKVAPSKVTLKTVGAAVKGLFVKKPAVATKSVKKAKAVKAKPVAAKAAAKKVAPKKVAAKATKKPAAKKTTRSAKK